jgi:hypothetical protein
MSVRHCNLLCTSFPTHRPCVQPRDLTPLQVHLAYLRQFWSVSRRVFFYGHAPKSSPFRIIAVTRHLPCRAYYSTLFNPAATHLLSAICATLLLTNLPRINIFELTSLHCTLFPTPTHSVQPRDLQVFLVHLHQFSSVSRRVFCNGCVARTSLFRIIEVTHDSVFPHCRDHLLQCHMTMGN